MSTDDEIRDAFHTAFAPAVADVTADPAMLSVVRRRHARQQRMLSVGAPLGIAAVTAGAVVGAVAIHPGSGHRATSPGHGGQTPNNQSTQTTVQTMQAVPMDGHNLSLPSDWTLSGNRKLIDLDTMEPQQPVGGKDQSVTATSPDGTQIFNATVYSGPISAAEQLGGNDATNDPSFAHVTINGNTASIKISGPPTTCVVYQPAHPLGTPDASRTLKDSATSPHSAKDYSTVEGACPPGDAARAPYGEARYIFNNGDFMMVDTNGMDEATLESFLTNALS